MRHSFDNAEKWSALFDDTARVAWQNPAEVARALRLAPGQVVLDIGAGTGYFSRFFAEGVRPGGRVYAADIEPDMIAWMLDRARREETPEVFPLLIPADEPRVPEPVDVVFICDTWHHIDDRIAYARKIRSILKPGGVVVVVDFRKGEIPVGPPEEHRLPPEKVIQEMEGAGLRLDRRDDVILPYQYVLFFRAA
jgi:ubiquinone/menaquinone biosynthesis C-methylase UbiE